MFVINENQSIFLTRGDIAIIQITANVSDNEKYTFVSGDIVRLKVFKKNKCDEIVLSKDVVVSTETQVVDIELEKSDTKIGELINKPIDYWYEIELNPETTPQTIVGYDADGPKIFRLFPEGGDTT